jgi:GTP cyclohydrolase I
MENQGSFVGMSLANGIQNTGQEQRIADEFQSHFFGARKVFPVWLTSLPGMEIAHHFMPCATAVIIAYIPSTC